MQSLASYEIFQLLQRLIWIEGTCASYLDLICIWLNIDRHLCDLFFWLPGGLYKRKYGSLSIENIHEYVIMQFADDVEIKTKSCLLSVSVALKKILANSTQIQTTSFGNTCCKLIVLRCKLSRCKQHCSSLHLILSSFYNYIIWGDIIIILCHMHYCWFSEPHLPECVKMFTWIHISIARDWEHTEWRCAGMSVRVCPHRALSSASTSSPAQRSTQTAPSAPVINRIMPVGTTLRDRERRGVWVCVSVCVTVVC